MVYADFESFTKSLSGCESSSDDSHVGSVIKSFASMRSFIHKSQSSTEQSEDEDVAQIFIEMLKENNKNIHKKLDFIKMIFTDEDRHEFKEAKQSWICKRSCDNDKDHSAAQLMADKDHSAAHPKADEVRHHCHFTRKYHEAPHYKCNQQFKKPKLTSVIFHNLPSYDCLLFIKNRGKSGGNIKCIPNNDK